MSGRVVVSIPSAWIEHCSIALPEIRVKRSGLTFAQFLFLEPNASDPLNKEAAEDLRTNRENFRRNVKTSMTGGSVKGIQYDRVLIK